VADEGGGDERPSRKAGGLDTGQDEGARLEIPGTPFSGGGLFGPFLPLVPPVGLTAFTTGVEGKD